MPEVQIETSILWYFKICLYSIRQPQSKLGNLYQSTHSFEEHTSLKYGATAILQAIF